MSNPAPDFTAIAAREFTARRAAAARLVALGELHPSQANELVLPWLAIACRAGCDLPELADLLEDFAAPPLGAPSRLTPAQVRAVVADDLCPLADLRDHLASATAAAILRSESSSSPDQITRARGLMALSRAMRCGPIPLPPPARKEAA